MIQWPWEAPPAPPPPPPSLHLVVNATEEQFIAGGLALVALSLITLLVACLTTRRSASPPPKTLVTVEASEACAGRVAVLTHGETSLAKHARRLLLQRGFKEVRCPLDRVALEACRGADRRHRPRVRGERKGGGG